MVVLEAMAFGKPVVVAAVGELASVVRNGEEGYIVPHGDTQQMATVLGDLLEDADQQTRMGHAARARMAALAPSFHVEAIALNWRKLLASLQLDH